MSDSDLKAIDPETLLQELRARESQHKEVVETFPCCRTPVAKRARGVAVAAELNPELKSYKTKDIITTLRGQQKVIYGTDDRMDVYQVTDPHILTDVESVVLLVSISDITDNGDGTSTLNVQTFGNAYNLCATEPFRNQPIVGFCSGFLVDPSIIATAGHCVNGSLPLNNTRFVFGFEMINANAAVTTIDNNEIYRGIRILGRQMGLDGTDWALIQLDRPVLNHPYVRIRRTGKIPNNTAVHVIGHPCTLPTKYADGANVRDNSPSRYFVANLDTYGGNSGSPVFNSTTHIVEGILVRGETDFVWNGTCRVSNVCPANGCQGESCTKTTEFDNLVPRNEHDFIYFNPIQAKVKKIRNRWKIVVGSMWLLDFGSKMNEAKKALKIIQHYGMNLQCFVGRPYPSMEFYLVNGLAPVGRMPGEDSIGFNPANLEVQRIRGRWKIVEGNHWLMDFNQQEDEARQALSYILRYGFQYICFVGRPGPSMTYFRK